MKKIFTVIALSGGIAINGYAQEGSIPATSEWKMVPIHMQSRWAKKVNPSNPLKEYPRPQMVRKKWENLNGLWKYAITVKDGPAPAKFDGQILVPFPIESALSGVQKPLLPDQNLWYKKRIQKPVLTSGERLLLHFGAVDWRATVFVNGTQVGEHLGGYQNFSFDITDYLKDGVNELLVKVFDPTDQGPNPHGKQVLNPANIYYTSSSGIWQTVWMEKVPNVFVESLTMTPNIDDGYLLLKINTNKNEESYSAEITAKAAGKSVSTINGAANNNLRLPITNMRVWSPDDPFLYDLTVRLLYKGKVVDEVKSYFGMRKVDIQKDEKGVDKIFLNNKYTYNLGTLDQGFWPDGLYTAPTDEALAFDIKAIKAMGFNTIRKHIKIEPARWYYHADKMGILVWQDFVNPPHGLPEGSKSVFEKEIKETLDQLNNYPSIITWVLFNEHWGAYDQKRLTDFVKDYDSSRLVNGHSGELLYVNEELRAPADSPWVNSDMTDVHSYPDPMNAPPQAGKARVLGEFGGVGVPVPGHEWTDLRGWGYIDVLPTQFEGKYAIMMKRLKKLEKEGLSGSIYTQPFDVEGEENGLLSYDRDVIKIPIDQLREINAILVPQAKGASLDPTFFIAENIDVNDNDNRYAELLQQYKNGKKDSAFLRRLTLMAIRKKDQTSATDIGNDYLSRLRQPFSKENVIFIWDITRTSKDKGFQMYKTQREKINDILGDNSAERKIREIIYKEEIAPYYKANINMDLKWDEIQNKITSKYGELGEETVYGRRMLYYWTVTKDWENFAKYYVLYFEKALTRSEYHINNVSWDIFVHVNDQKILEFAVKVSKYNFEKFDKSPEAADTYANLLYKLGKVNEAIELEEKALKLSNNAREIEENLIKMKNHQPTWTKFESTN